MAVEAVFALDDGGGSLSRVRGAQFTGDRGLGVSVHAPSPLMDDGGVTSEAIAGLGEAGVCGEED